METGKVKEKKRGNYNGIIRGNIRGMVLCGLFAAIIAVFTLITIPLPSGVPITLQTFAVALCGYTLGCGKGTAATAVYIAIGAVGLPVFSGMRGGFSVLAGPTGGYIYGFIGMTALCGVGAIICSRLAGKSRVGGAVGRHFSERSGCIVAKDGEKSAKGCPDSVVKSPSGAGTSGAGTSGAGTSDIGTSGGHPRGERSRILGVVGSAAGILFGLFGLAVCHVCGTIQFAALTGRTFADAALVASVPYLAKDVISVAGAFVLGRMISSRVLRK